MSGLFITFEGIDGCGKTTQLQLLESWLRQQNIPVLCTREPGGTQLGQQIRTLLLDPEHRSLSAEAELLLYLADRIQHLREVILPATAEGNVVLCDRFHDSTIAYQGYGRGFDLSAIHSIVEKEVLPYMPDLSIFLDIPASIAMERTQQRTLNTLKDSDGSENKLDRIDSESLEFFDRVNLGFHTLLSAEPKRFLCLDATEDKKKIHQKLIMALGNTPSFRSLNF